MAMRGHGSAPQWVYGRSISLLLLELAQNEGGEIHPGRWFVGSDSCTKIASATEATLAELAS